MKILQTLKEAWALLIAGERATGWERWESSKLGGVEEGRGENEAA